MIKKSASEPYLGVLITISISISFKNVYAYSKRILEIVRSEHMMKRLVIKSFYLHVM